MRQLVICEKPSVARDVAAALAGQHTFTKTPWGFSSPGMLVAAAAGHLVAELTPERYDEKYAKWTFESLPILPERFMYQPRDSNAAARLRQLADLLTDPSVDEIVNACDAGREGELIFKLIVQFARLNPAKPVKRAWFSSMTPGAIQQAFATLRPDREMLPLEAAARCRSEADWYVGMNATRAATCTLGGGKNLLSMGRVQTPTLALVVRRDLEIDTFVPQDYFCIRGQFAAATGVYTGWWRSSRETGADDRFIDRTAADALAARVRAGRRSWVEEVVIRDEQVGAPKLFDLNELQREANRRYGMTAAKTLEAAQACYDEHKVLSYPRTDSCWLTTDMIPEVPKLMARVRAADAVYVPLTDAVASAAIDPARLANDAKVNDHHAIVPTDAAHDLSKLTPDQRRVYDLVARRFIAALLPAQRLERTVVWTGVDCADETGAGTTEWFRTAGTRVIDPGWKIALPEPPASKGKKAAAGDDGDDGENSDDGDDAGDLPALSAQTPVRTESVTVTEHQTKPPVRFNEASLLGAMATAGRLVTDDEMAEAMKDSGLGTPATRASVIERLMAVEYLERVGRQIRATAKGRGLVMALGDHPLTHPDLTGGWEQRLRHLERSDPDATPALRQQFVTDVREFTRGIVLGFTDRTPEQLAVGRRPIAPCPVAGCAGTVIEGRKAWGCDTYTSREQPGCGFLVWKEQSGKKLTEKDLMKRIDEVRSGKVEVRPAAARVVLGPCPSPGCAGEIVERPKSWGCTSWRGPKDPGCGYAIWKSNSDGSQVSPADALELLRAGRSNAREQPAGVAECPRCGSREQIVDRGKFFGCTSWKSPKASGCGTTIWKVQAGHEITPDELAEQLGALVGTKAEKRPTRPARPATKTAGSRSSARR